MHSLWVGKDEAEGVAGNLEWNSLEFLSTHTSIREDGVVQVYAYLMITLFLMRHTIEANM